MKDVTTLFLRLFDRVTVYRNGRRFWAAAFVDLFASGRTLGDSSILGKAGAGSGYARRDCPPLAILIVDAMNRPAAGRLPRRGYGTHELAF